MKRTVAQLRAWRSSGLTLAGFAGITASLWVAFGLAAGLAAVGLSCLVVEYLSREDAP